MGLVSHLTIELGCERTSEEMHKVIMNGITLPAILNMVSVNDSEISSLLAETLKHLLEAGAFDCVICRPVDFVSNRVMTRFHKIQVVGRGWPSLPA